MGLPNQTQFYFESYIDFLRSQTDLLLIFFGSYIDFPSNLHLIMTAWLLQAVGLPTLSLKPKDFKSKPQFELKRKKKTRIGLFVIKEKDGDTLLIVHQKIFYIG